MQQKFLPPFNLLLVKYKYDRLLTKVIANNILKAAIFLYRDCWKCGDTILYSTQQQQFFANCYLERLCATSATL